MTGIAMKQRDVNTPTAEAGISGLATEGLRSTASSDYRAVVIRRHAVEILNYFGNCPCCGYAAQATMMITVCADNSTTREPIGRCALPCGWTGPVEITTMTAGAM
ncbi:hypothetical protein FHY52_00650 [Nocardia nova]|jgi:hypothetical protein|uniref:hypothetical protein n=1 Tax=Nocardia nova TaxID=37330 RepID=UPI0025AF4027|nr:hypothetical protein [Nocardia nova]MDN2495235.1 hypothetical protein [Nocardia nova]